VRRVAELDESFNHGAVPEFLITLEASHTGVKADERQKAMRRHFNRAIELSGGKRVGTYVSFAENVDIPAQNLIEFQEMLDRALAIDVDADPGNRLANLVAQRRARWLLAHTKDLFVDAGSAPKPDEPAHT
jgi:predicted anti-sigma-YlaC factor YlaD